MCRGRAFFTEKRKGFFFFGQAACLEDDGAGCASLRLDVVVTHRLSFLSPVSMTALPLGVKSCLTWASGVGRVLLTKINCSDSCCCPDIHHAGTQAICSFHVNADLAQCVEGGFVSDISQGGEKRAGENDLTLGITIFSISVVTVTIRIKAGSRFLERCLFYFFYCQDTSYLDSPS